MESYKLFNYTELRDPKKYYKKPPGKPLSMISVQPNDFDGRNYNPLVMYFSINPYRIKDFRKLLLQSKRKEYLSDYSNSLLNSCFKKW